MSSVDLSESQKEILQVLVDLSRENATAVKGESIARNVGRNPGTIRNQMQSLKALQLVEGVPGPKGGYKPTANAYNTLDTQGMDEIAAVTLTHNGVPVENLNVRGISLLNVHHPENCRAEVNLDGSAHGLANGETVTIGPTPKSRLSITGQVDGDAGTQELLVIDIESMEAPIED